MHDHLGNDFSQPQVGIDIFGIDDAQRAGQRQHRPVAGVKLALFGEFQRGEVHLVDGGVAQEQGRWRDGGTRLHDGCR